ncbi:tetratricopeptide repeat protein [Flavobacterium sp. W21_SRS_FM6]|uniref:tetratricopeptide repeat protein n=1 Tax=Flavobacterium sp. W21_SRS_FM6 TaxID=3240268 RepID=UPI003F902818
MKWLFSELIRRNVISTMIAYAGLTWLLLQVVAVVSSVMPVHSMVAPGVLLLLVCAFPVTAYISWHFDISFKGISRTPSLDKDDNPTLKKFGLWNWLGLLSIVVVSGFVGIQYFSVIKSEQVAAQQRLAAIKKADSIAVLPFIDQSPSKNQRYLALGLSEEITSLLGRSNNFKVSASRSSQILTEKGLAPIEIGRRLAVATVLTGTVKVTGERLKIRVELLDTENGHTLWTETFSRELKDIFAIESEIGRSVVNLLQDKYTETGDLTSFSATSSTDAYVMYLKGREEYRKQTTESLKAARKFFEQAVALDPEYAQGYVGLADTLVLLAEGDTRFGVLKTDIAAALAQQNIDKALVRQPDMAEAFAVKGYIAFMQDDFDNAITDYNKAIELNPSLAIAYMWKNLALEALQRFDESLTALRKARELDPLFQTNSYNLGVVLAGRGRFEEAKNIFTQLQTDFPKSTFPHEGLADIYFSTGDFVGAIREGQKAVKLSPDNQDLAFRMIGPLLQLGLTEVVREKASEPSWVGAYEYYFENILIFEKNYDTLFERMNFKVAANPDDYWVAFEAGWYNAMFGDKKKALRLLTEKLSLIEEIEMFGMPYCSPAIEIAWAQKELGADENYVRNLTTCKALMEEQLKASIIYSELYYLAARIFALEGKSVEALEALSEAINKGWREWWTQYDPLLESLRGMDEYQIQIKIIDDDLARQRQEAKRLFLR